ncbi:MAG TPA: hypothetical protein PKL88_01100, partial [bacterium]|nr:hypothetical protein [bacterium]
FLVRTVLAATETDPSFSGDPISGTIIKTDSSLIDVFTTVTNIVIWVGLGLVLVFLALGFIKFITSQGDKVATEQAQKWVTYAVIGGVGLLLVFSIKSVLLKLVRPST